MVTVAMLAAALAGTEPEAMEPPGEADVGDEAVEDTTTSVTPEFTDVPPEPLPPPEPVAPATDWKGLLDEARAMATDGRTEAARATLRYIVDGDAPPEVKGGARAQLTALPARLVRDGSRMNAAKVVIWQSLYGAATLGSLTAVATEDETASLLAVHAGGAAGGFSALLWKRAYGLDMANTTAIIGLEQAGVYHALMVLGAAEADADHIPVGMLVGGLGGAAVATQVLRLDLEDRTVSGAYSGAFWGLGAGAGLLTVAYLWDSSPSTVFPLLLASTDLGAVGGGLLARRLDVDRDQLRMANLGALFGAGTAYCFAWASQDDVLWTEAALAGAMMVGAGAGGATGALVVRWFDRPVLPDLELSMGMPLIVPERRGVQVQLPIVQGRF